MKVIPAGGKKDTRGRRKRQERQKKVQSLLVKTSSALYETRKLITAFTTAHHWSRA
jgi:hypothetical protein